MRFFCEIRPTLQFESLIETMFTLAAQGKTKRAAPLGRALGYRAVAEGIR